MGLIDAIVDRSFRDTQSGRVVVFSGDRRKRGYLVRSVAEEKKIRSFLKMFYFAHLYILVFGTLLSRGFASSLSYGSFERPAHHLLGSVSFFVGIYLLLVGVPYALLWRVKANSCQSLGQAADVQCDRYLVGTDRIRVPLWTFSSSEILKTTPLRPCHSAIPLSTIEF
jgi:hypothetical protein